MVMRSRSPEQRQPLVLTEPRRRKLKLRRPFPKARRRDARRKEKDARKGKVADRPIRADTIVFPEDQPGKGHRVSFTPRDEPPFRPPALRRDKDSSPAREEKGKSKGKGKGRGKGKGKKGKKGKGKKAGDQWWPRQSDDQWRPRQSDHWR